MSTFTSEITIQAPVGQAYRAFTNSSALREWLCDVSTVAPHPGGRFYLWWNGDFYSSGHFLALEENKLVSFRWFSSIDPAPTEVSVRLETTQDGVRVRLDHKVPDNEAWEKTGQEFKQHWDDSLENLKSILERGIDLRIANRPMLGILPGDFTHEQALALGVPVTEGLRLDGTLEEMGAFKAGLRKNDVLVSINNKPITNDFSSLIMAISGVKGGDTVPVEYYRGSQKHKVMMTLSKRPMTDVPFNTTELVEQARPKLRAAMTALKDCFEGVSEAQARKRPAEEEWSALDTVSHLLHNERNLRTFFDDLLGGHERFSDDFSGNIDAHIRATTAVHTTIQDMLDEMERANQETLLYVANLPAEATQRKSAFYRLGDALLQSDRHIYSHIEQIKAALKTAQ